VPFFFFVFFLLIILQLQTKVRYWIGTCSSMLNHLLTFFVVLMFVGRSRSNPTATPYAPLACTVPLVLLQTLPSAKWVSTARRAQPPQSRARPVTDAIRKAWPLLIRPTNGVWPGIIVPLARQVLRKVCVRPATFVLPSRLPRSHALLRPYALPAAWSLR
jgi:hypothetical protein